MKKATFKETEKKVTTGFDIDCDGKFKYEKTLEEIKTDSILREMQIEDFFNVMEEKIKALEDSKELSLLRFGYQEALKTFINGK